MLSHEAYFLANLPLVVAYFAVTAPSTVPRRYVALLAPPLVVAALIVLFGRYEPGLPALRDYFAASPRYLEATGGAVDEDAVAVITRGASEDLAVIVEMFWTKQGWLHVPIILAWLALMTGFFSRFYRRNNLPRDALFYASYGPLLLGAIG